MRRRSVGLRGPGRRPCASSTGISRRTATVHRNRGGGIRFTIGICVDRPDQVDEAAASAYVADPEGNYFEIAWAGPDNPIVRAAVRAVTSGA